MTVAHWQQFVVVVLVVAAAGSLVRRAWRALVPPRAAPGCAHCPSAEGTTDYSPSTGRR
jgi:hypothetical protein